MSFEVRGAGLTLWLCLVTAGTCYGGDQSPRPIEVVVSQRTANLSSNFDEELPIEKKNLESAFPGAPHRLDPDSMQGIPQPLPPPAPTTKLTQHDRDMLDRRENWVFMTPEEMMLGTDAKKELGLDKYDKKGIDGEPTSAMERYYLRLIGSDHPEATTNGLAKANNRDDRATNSFNSGAERNEERANVFSSPFNNTPPTPIFQAERPKSFLDNFGPSSDSTIRSPEEIRVEHEEKAHMESFKELWDIDQPASAGALSGVPASTASSFAGSSHPVSSEGAGASAQSSSSSTQTSVTSVHTTPLPHPDFTAPRRRF